MDLHRGNRRVISIARPGMADTVLVGVLLMAMYVMRYLPVSEVPFCVEMKYTDRA